MVDQVFIDALQLHAVPPLAAHGVQRLGGLGSPTPREDRTERPRRHGVIDLTTYYGGRVLSLEGLTRADDLATFWARVDELKQQFALNGLEHTLKWRRKGLAYTEQSIVTVATELELGYAADSPFARWAVDLVAADPRMYVSTQSSVAGATTAAATTGGNFMTPPIITVTVNAAAATITNTSLAAENVFRLTGLTSGWVIEIDVANRTVKRAGVEHAEYVDDVGGTNWWQLRGGLANAITTTGVSAIGVAWNDARI